MGGESAGDFFRRAGEIARDCAVRIKPQTPSSKKRPHCVWNLKFGASLELGGWCLDLLFYFAAESSRPLPWALLMVTSAPVKPVTLTAEKFTFVMFAMAMARPHVPEISASVKPSSGRAGG